jgi:predicted O-methyltransferase YrrM
MHRTTNYPLDHIGRNFGTDQSSLHHDYLHILERYFELRRNEAINLLEIGVAGGGSIRTWHEYFPHAAIYGIDHNHEYINALELAMTVEKWHARVRLVEGDAERVETWARFKDWGDPMFDIIIDDGSHLSGKIIETFHCGFTHLAPKGLYIIEDLHAVYDEAKKVNSDKFIHAVEYFKNWVDMVNEQGGGYIGKPSPEAPIKSLHFYKSLVIIERA